MDDPLVVKPGEKIIVIDIDSEVLYSDYESMSGSKKDSHLLDVIGSKEQAILRLISVALDRPGALAEGDVTFRAERKRVRVMHEPNFRTHIIFSPWEPDPPKKWEVEKPA